MGPGTERGDLSFQCIFRCMTFHEMQFSGFQVFFFPAGPNIQRLHYLSMLCLFLSSPYPSSIIQSTSFCQGLPLPSIISLQRVTSRNVSYPVLLDGSDCIHKASLFFHLLQYLFV